MTRSMTALGAGYGEVYRMMRPTWAEEYGTGSSGDVFCTGGRAAHGSEGYVMLIQQELELLPRCAVEFN